MFLSEFDQNKEKLSLDVIPDEDNKKLNSYVFDRKTKLKNLTVFDLAIILQ